MREPGALKRVLDLAVSSAALVLTAPVLAVAAAAIKLDSPGPVLFRQERVGRNRQPLRTLKLRTMHVESDRKGLQITAGNDPRITRVGRWLRRTKLDELPQLWNVVRGEMSLVGPRPEVPRYVGAYRAEWQRLLDVRPGLTDRASITFRDEEALLSLAADRERAYLEVIMPLKLELALRGVDEGSLRSDLGVLFRTACAVLRVQTPDDEAVLAEARRQIEHLNNMSDAS